MNENVRIPQKLIEIHSCNNIAVSLIYNFFINSFEKYCEQITH